MLVAKVHLENIPKTCLMVNHYGIELVGLDMHVSDHQENGLSQEVNGEKLEQEELMDLLQPQMIVQILKIQNGKMQRL